MTRDLRSILKAAIEGRVVLRFVYNGKSRIVEPQTYGVSTTGNELLRGYQREGGSRSGSVARLKLFEISKISNLEVNDERFGGARPEHKPEDSAMIEVFATLPKPEAT